MSDTLTNVILPKDEWVDLYAATGVPVGTKIAVENTGVNDVLLAAQETEPVSPNHNSYNIIKRDSDIPLSNTAGDPGAWALSRSMDGEVNVNPMIQSGFYPDAPEKLPLTAFGEMSVAESTPITQILAVNGFTDKTNEFVSGTGIAITEDSQFKMSTGTAVGAFSSIVTAATIPYRAGEGLKELISAKFPAGIANSVSLAGFLSSTDGLAFGFQNTVFGIVRRHDGRSEIQELIFTTGASGAENATITIDGTPFTVPLTAGTVNHNALEAAESLAAQVANWTFTSNDDAVVAVAIVAQPAGVFSFSSATAVAAFDQISAGLQPTEDFFPRSSWNVNKRPDLDPTKLNVYGVRFQYLGAGGIFFFVENPSTGMLDLVHRIDYTNTSDIPSLGDPNMTVGWAIASTGSTTDIEMSGVSAGGFVEGKDVITERPRSIQNTLISTGSIPINLFTVRNRTVKADRRNASITHMLAANGFTDSNKGAVIDLLIDADVAGEPDFQYIDKGRSITEVDFAGTIVTGGTSIGALALPPTDGDSINLSELMATLGSGQTLTAAARVISGAVSDITGTLVLQEDL